MEVEEEEWFTRYGEVKYKDTDTDKKAVLGTSLCNNKQNITHTDTYASAANNSTVMVSAPRGLFLFMHCVLN